MCLAREHGRLLLKLYELFRTSAGGTETANTRRTWNRRCYTSKEGVRRVVRLEDVAGDGASFRGVSEYHSRS